MAHSTQETDEEILQSFSREIRKKKGGHFLDLGVEGSGLRWGYGVNSCLQKHINQMGSCKKSIMTYGYFVG